jgi:hypothetical protein
MVHFTNSDREGEAPAELETLRFLRLHGSAGASPSPSVNNNQSG